MLGNEKCQTRNLHCYLEETLKSSWGVIHSDIFMGWEKGYSSDIFYGLVCGS